MPTHSRKHPTSQPRRPFTIRLSVEEFAGLKQRAADAGLRPAEVARIFITQRQVRAATPALNVQMWSKLGSLQAQLEELLADRSFREFDRIQFGSLSDEVANVRLALLGYDRKNK